MRQKQAQLKYLNHQSEDSINNKKPEPKMPEKRSESKLSLLLNGKLQKDVQQGEKITNNNNIQKKEDITKQGDIFHNKNIAINDEADNGVVLAQQSALSAENDLKSITSSTQKECSHLSRCSHI